MVFMMLLQRLCKPKGGFVLYLKLRALCYLSHTERGWLNRTPPRNFLSRVLDAAFFYGKLDKRRATHNQRKAGVAMSEWGSKFVTSNNAVSNCYA
jgi:hypothetical protein